MADTSGTFRAQAALAVLSTLSLATSSIWEGINKGTIMRYSWLMMYPNYNSVVCWWWRGEGVSADWEAQMATPLFILY